MAASQLVEFIEKGLKDGKRPDELQFQAIHELGASISEFNRAFDQIILKEHERAPAVAPAPDFKAAPPETIYQPETKPAAKHRVGFFNPFGWFKHHKVATSILVLVGALAVGGYVAADMLLAPGIDRVGGLVYERLQNMDSVEYEGSIEGEVTTEALVTLDSFLRYGPQRYANRDERVAGSKNTKVRLDFKGATDVRDTVNAKSEIALTLTAEGFVVGVDVKSVSDDLFLRITELPDLGLFDASILINQWFLVDYDKLGDTVKQPMAEPDSALTEQQKKRVLEIIARAHIFKFAEKIGNDSIDGKAAYHYRYTIDEMALLGAMKEISREVTGEDLELIPQEEQEFLEWLDVAGGEIWLAKRDLSPLKLTFDLAMRTVADAPATGRLSMSLKFNKYNEDVVIEAPFPFKKLSEMFQELIPASTPASRDADRISHVRQLQTALELYEFDYGSYPNTLDQLLSGDESALLDALPQAPTPQDGTCTEQQNQYQYKPTSNYRNYQLTFCLGADTAGFAAGLRTANASGIK
jgi:hypothetical protein